MESFKLAFKLGLQRTVSSTFVMLSRNSDNVKEDGCRQIFARVRDGDKYKRKDVFKVNIGRQVQGGRVDKFRDFFCDESYYYISLCNNCHIS